MPLSTDGGAPTGRLVLVATPIGNLGDLSPRAVDTLAGADLVCCEDTRRTRALLSHAGVRVRALLAVHEHNEDRQAAAVARRLQAGETVALVTDAGTPGISDPGALVVRAALAAGASVSVVPGPNAAVAALVASGLPADRFCFEGFLPRRGPARRQRLAAIAADERTTVVHEAPGRLVGTLADLRDALGPERPIAVVRELTKVHEEVWRGEVGDAAGAFAARAAGDGVRGEIVVVIGGSPPARGEPTDDEIADALQGPLGAGTSVRDAAAAVAEALGVSRRRAYALALRGRNAEPGKDVDPGVT